MSNFIIGKMTFKRFDKPIEKKIETENYKYDDTYEDEPKPILKHKIVPFQPYTNIKNHKYNSSSQLCIKSK